MANRGLAATFWAVMKCDSCDEKATVFYTQVTDGKLKKFVLCEKCAAEQGITNPDGMVMPSELLTGSDLPQSPLDLFEPEADSGVSECPDCGFTLEDFKRVGRLGCGGCYGAFKQEISRRLPSLHKGTSHTGYFPAEIAKLHAWQTEITDLTAQLENAVLVEDYEKAAKLRDKINELESQGKGLASQ